MAKLTKAEWETRRKAVLAQAASLPDGATVRLEIDGAAAIMAAPLRDFGSGSRGYNATGKVTGESGVVFQVSMSAVAVGSGPYKADA